MRVQDKERSYNQTDTPTTWSNAPAEHQRRPIAVMRDQDQSMFQGRHADCRAAQLRHVSVPGSYSAQCPDSDRSSRGIGWHPVTTMSPPASTEKQLNMASAQEENDAAPSPRRKGGRAQKLELLARPTTIVLIVQLVALARVIIDKLA